MEWKMKISLILFTLLFSLSGYSWVVERENGDFYLKNLDGQKFAIESVGGVPEFIEVKKMSDNHEKLIYKAGEAGTAEVIEVQRAIVFNRSSNKTLGDFPYKYNDLSSQKSLDQPKWSLLEGKLTVTDQASGLSKEVILE